MAYSLELMVELVCGLLNSPHGGIDDGKVDSVRKIVTSTLQESQRNLSWVCVTDCYCLADFFLDFSYRALLACGIIEQSRGLCTSLSAGTVVQKSQTCQE
jgi:hypothetical protein